VDLMALREKRVGDVGADKPGAAGHQNCHVTKGSDVNGNSWACQHFPDTEDPGRRSGQFPSLGRELTQLGHRLPRTTSKLSGRCRVQTRRSICRLNPEVL
jgi:hypothetical protein